MIFSEQEIIEQTYSKKATIQRYGEYKTEWNETRVGLATIYSVISCDIAQNVGRNTTQTPSNNEVEYDLKMYCSPNYAIEAGDLVEITYENNLKRVFNAGEPMIYTSYIAIPLVKVGVA